MIKDGSPNEAAQAAALDERQARLKKWNRAVRFFTALAIASFIGLMKLEMKWAGAVSFLVGLFALVAVRSCVERADRAQNEVYRS